MNKKVKILGFTSYKNNTITFASDQQLTYGSIDIKNDTVYFYSKTYKDPTNLDYKKHTFISMQDFYSFLDINGFILSTVLLQMIQKAARNISIEINKNDLAAINIFKLYIENLIQDLEKEKYENLQYLDSTEIYNLSKIIKLANELQDTSIKLAGELDLIVNKAIKTN